VERTFLVLGALLALVGVGLEAFGAHALRSRLTPDRVVTFETAVRYQLWHALALFAASSGRHRAILDGDCGRAEEQIARAREFGEAVYGPSAETIYWGSRLPSMGQYDEYPAGAVGRCARPGGQLL
jgi:hypothetical protein